MKISPEQMNIEKTRAESDEKLIRKGAKIEVSEEGERGLVLKDDQIDSAKYEMEYNINDKEKPKREVIKCLQQGYIGSATSLKKNWSLPDEYFETPEIQSILGEALDKSLIKCLKDGSDYNVIELVENFNVPISTEAVKMAGDYVIQKLARGSGVYSYFMEKFHPETVWNHQTKEELFDKAVKAMDEKDFLKLKAKKAELDQEGKKLYDVLPEEVDYFIENIGKLFGLDEEQKRELSLKFVSYLLKESVYDFYLVSAGRKDQLIGKNLRDSAYIKTSLDLINKFNLTDELSLDTQQMAIDALEGSLRNYVHDCIGTHQSYKKEKLDYILSLVEMFKIDKDIIQKLAISMISDELKKYSHKNTYEMVLSFDGVQKLSKELDLPIKEIERQVKEKTQGKQDWVWEKDE